MRDYATFKDGHKEEIIFYRVDNYNPPRIYFMTPSGIYIYEQQGREEGIKLPNEGKLIRLVDNRFYKYDKENVDLVADFPFANKDVNARWIYCNDIESISFSYPN